MRVLQKHKSCTKWSTGAEMKALSPVGASSQVELEKGHGSPIMFLLVTVIGSKTPLHATNLKNLLENLKRSITHAQSSEKLQLQWWGWGVCSRKQGWRRGPQRLFWGWGDSRKDFKLLSNNPDLHFRQTRIPCAENLTLGRILPLILVNQQMEIIKRLHHQRGRNSHPYRCLLGPYFAFFPLSKVSSGPRPLPVPGILCWWLSSGE